MRWGEKSDGKWQIADGKKNCFCLLEHLQLCSLNDESAIKQVIYPSFRYAPLFAFPSRTLVSLTCGIKAFETIFIRCFLANNYDAEIYSWSGSHRYKRQMPFNRCRFRMRNKSHPCMRPHVYPLGRKIVHNEIYIDFGSRFFFILFFAFLSTDLFQ